MPGRRLPLAGGQQLVGLAPANLLPEHGGLGEAKVRQAPRGGPVRSVPAANRPLSKCARDNVAGDLPARGQSVGTVQPHHYGVTRPSDLPPLVLLVV